MNPKRKAQKALRRRQSLAKERKHYEFVKNMSSYDPRVGYVEHGYVEGNWVPVGKYVKYPKNSKRQKYAKQQTSRRNRRLKTELPTKGNKYRRAFDYWWDLY